MAAAFRHGFMHSPAMASCQMLLDGDSRYSAILDRFAAGRLRAEANMF
jgi:hypothetical protein